MKDHRPTLPEPAFDSIPNAELSADQMLHLPLVILPEQVVFPYMTTTLVLDTPAAVAATEYALEHQQTLMVTLRRRDQPAGTPLTDTMHLIGMEIAPQRLRSVSAHLKTVMVEGRRRLRVVEITGTEPFIRVRAEPVTDASDDEDQVYAGREAVLSLFQQMVDMDDDMPDEMVDYIFLLESPSALVEALAPGLEMDVDARQALLEETSIVKRLELVAIQLGKEINRLEIEDEVHDRVNEEINKVQREMYLREQMRVIQDELGEGEEDVFNQEIDELRQRIQAADLPAEVLERTLKEASRLAIMAPMSPESGVIRTYIDWLLSLPWQHSSKDNLNILNAEKVLNKAHYGLDKVKDRVLEHIAVRKLARDKMKSPILCFVGPPGVGKTSLGQSIAEALGRKFVRVSLGGVHDEAEIRGHRRTYIGALPGRIIQTLKRAGTKNPVFMLDEIDKLTEDYRGDPSAALLEVLDPEQNKEFVDHYLEVPYDLSEVLFIATANDLYPLQDALEDRLEIIEFRAYTEEEKLEIARRFLIPRQLEAHGLAKRGILFTMPALQTLIQQYTLEAGVRNLEREIGGICRKITRLVATRKKYPKRITPDIVEKFLGPPYVFKTRLNREDHIGLATGLVWSASGGDVQIIEASLLPGKGSLTLTGSLGDVLQESAQTALSYMRARAKDFGVPYDDFENYDVHIHMPEGSVPKEGPSAGITLATAIISVFTERPIRSDTAMTGEVTLRGHVLPVGGVKEKVLAARRHGLKKVILPADNQKDLVDVPKQVLRDLQITFVEHMQQVIDLMLLEAPAQRQRDLDAQALEERETADEDAPQKPRARRRKKDADDA
ncbi:MAG: endopeptidase La [Anaerolineae bacterium]|jgi:ATP-dependent Lon protease|nr:endopeptidase La [Anaerolineae bacterium]